MTGIDFIEVVDPAVQTLLRVYFIIDPDQLADPLAVIDAAFEVGRVAIVSNSSGVRVEVENATWRRVDDRTVLEVETEAPGDFSIHRLTLDDEDHDPPRIDRFFNGVEFSFKQGCPSVLDCRERERECPPPEWVDFPIDYLARDFSSLRGALLDFAAQRYPEWTERIEADAGVMLAEVMAALGDELSYVQDRYARESTLETATQRRSLRWHTRLVDHPIDNGQSATTCLALKVGSVGAPGKYISAGRRVWAPCENGSFIPFEVGEGLRDQRRFWAHREWDELTAHVPDPSKPCLPAGSTELFLIGTFPEAGQLPTVDDEEQDDSGEWVSRLVLLKATPEDSSLPERRHLVRITGVSHGEDQLCLDEADQPVRYTRIAWDASEALPFDFYLPTTTVCANIVPAISGETVATMFVIGKDEAGAAGLPAAVERQGPCNELTGERTPLYLFSLLDSETQGLGWQGSNGVAAPEIELLEDPEGVPDPWEWQPSLLDSTAQNPHFTVEHGTWRTIFRVERFGRAFEHPDYASGAGFTIRFGDGEFGRLPPQGSVFRVVYRTGPGRAANLPADTVTRIQDPDPDGSSETLENLAESVTNPFAITDGADPQPAEVIKQLAPEAFKAETLRAVRDEDYREQAEKVPGVQQAGARARWTGSWLTEFVTVDPLGSFALSDDLRAAVANRLDCVRQVGREVFVRDPHYLDLDLEIEICIEPFAYAGQVVERVVRALTVPARRGARLDPPFFHPDNFTFGTPLYRADLEAAIQAVPGVRGVLRIWIRVRGITKRREFTELIFPVADNRILRLQNDPRFPDRGSLKIVPR